MHISNCAHMHKQNCPPPVGYRGPGGFKAAPQARPRPPPPGADPQYVECTTYPHALWLTNFPINRLWEWFDKVDKDQSGDIDATELRKCWFHSGSRFVAYVSPRARSDKRRLVPCVILDVDLTGADHLTASRL